MKHFKKSSFVWIALLTSCSVFSPVKTTTKDNYLLNTLPHVAIKNKHSTTVLVMPVQTNTIYNTTRIAYSTRNHQITYFANSHWAESPTSMLQQLIIQTLQNTHYFHAVVASSAVGNYDFILNTQLTELKQDFTYKPSLVRMKVSAELTRMSDNQIVAVKQFDAIATAPQDTPCGGVTAANQATEEILKKLSNFVVNHSR